ncbi:DnaJ-domain-containing protein [Russula vinacea]|nr:DnaJ-domain-containing protein [Russula vinacea]
MSKDPSASNTPAESSTPASELSDANLERLLNREASAIQRELEVERILTAFKLNPYDVLDLGPSATAEDIKKKYRQLSLFIHPDKCTHARAPEAFDVLKKVIRLLLLLQLRKRLILLFIQKAENELGDTAKREDLDAAINQARLTLLKELSLPTSTPDDHPRLKGLTPPFKAQLRQKSKELLIEEEVRRRRAVKMNLANEETREQRVGSWRTFTNTSKKNKKKKGDVLG